MKTKLVLLITALTLLLLSVGCKPNAESAALLEADPGARADQSGTIYISHVEPANLTLTKQPTNFTIGFAEPMNQDSVEQALQVCPGVEYSTRWSDKDLLITILRGVEKLSSCTISLSAPVESLEGEVYPGTSWEVVVQLPTSTPTRTPISPSTPVPTRTPTFVSTPTTTLDPNVVIEDPLFIIADWKMAQATTTPIAPPDIEQNDATLKDFSSEEYINLIHSLDTYAVENDRLYPGETRPYFISNQEPIKVIVQEALLAFPDTEFAKELRWKLALINAVLANNETDQWIVDQIEDGLNQNLFSPDNLDQYLNQFSFEVALEFTIPDLFGKGKENQVYIINTAHLHNIGGTDDGLVVALDGDAPGDYHLYLVTSWWKFDNGYWARRQDENDSDCQNYSYDLNHNGRPEICLFSEIGASGRFPQRLFLFEWQGDQFINLAADIDTWYMNDLVTIQPENLPGIDIEVYRADSYPEGLYQYAWNEDELRLEKLEYSYLLTGSNDLFYREDFSGAINLLRNQLEAGPPYKRFAWMHSQLSDEGTDTIRFLLGLAYAYNAESTAARDTFISLAQSPTNQQFPIFSQTAEVFVDRYFDVVDLYSACAESIELLNSAIQTNGESPLSEIFGYDLLFFDPLTYFCSSPILINQTIKSISPNASTELPDILRNAGFGVVKSQPFDALNDGNRDWAIIINQPGTNDPITVLAVEYQGNWIAYQVFDNTFTTALNVDLIYLDYLTYPAVLVQDGTYIQIYELLPEGDSLSFNLLHKELASSYSFHQLQDQRVLITFSSIDKYDETTWEEYEVDTQRVNIWDPNGKSFKISTLSPFDDPRYYLEQNPITSDTDASSLYLIGLAYELLGDQTTAAQFYWRVWTEFPGTPYALMARAKLEPLSP